MIKIQDFCIEIFENVSDFDMNFFKVVFFAVLINITTINNSSFLYQNINQKCQYI